jgi:hypothetical protein
VPFKPDLTFAFQLVNKPVDLLAIEMYDPSNLRVLKLAHTYACTTLLGRFFP